MYFDITFFFATFQQPICSVLWDTRQDFLLYFTWRRDWKDTISFKGIPRYFTCWCFTVNFVQYWGTVKYLMIVILLVCSKYINLWFWNIVYGYFTKNTSSLQKVPLSIVFLSFFFKYKCPYSVKKHMNVHVFYKLEHFLVLRTVSIDYLNECVRFEMIIGNKICHFYGYKYVSSYKMNLKTLKAKGVGCSKGLNYHVSDFRDFRVRQFFPCNFRFRSSLKPQTLFRKMVLAWTSGNKIKL